MARRIVVDSFAYDFVPDDPPALADRTWSLVQGRVIDEITGEPLTAMTVSVAEPELGVKTGAGGTYTVFARPWHRFSPLDAPSYTISISIEADGYLPATRLVTITTGQRTIAAPAPVVPTNVITLSSTAGLVSGQLLLLGPAGSGQERRTIASIGPAANQVTLAAPVALPHPVGVPVVADAFVPIVLADTAMHRVGVSIRGRAVRRNATGIGTQPIPGATISVQGLWRSAQAVAQHLPPVPGDGVSLSPGLYAVRSVGSTLAVQGLPVVPGDDKLMLDPASAGETRVRVSNRLNLVFPPAPPPHSVLCIDPDNAELTEYVGITAADGLGAVTEPGNVTLEHQLCADHRRGVRVQRVAPLAASLPKTLTDAGAPGDCCVFVSNLAGLAAAATVVVTGGPAPREYHNIHTFNAVSDADGYFRLPPISRVAQVRIDANAPPLAPMTFDYQPDYARRENWIDVVFP